MIATATFSSYILFFNILSLLWLPDVACCCKLTPKIGTIFSVKQTVAYFSGFSIVGVE